MKLKWTIGVVLLSAIGLLATFQNCAQTGSGLSTNESSSDSGYVDPQFKNLPFPYSITANQLAYLSCGDGNNFTFKIGAYSDSEATYPFSAANDTEQRLSVGGISLNSSFLSDFESKLASNITSSAKRDKLYEALTTISAGKNIQPFFSVRSLKNNDKEIANPEALLTYSGTSKANQYFFPLGLLSGSVYANLLSKDSTKSRSYFPAAADERRTLEAELTFKSSSDEETFLSDVGQGGLLLGFTDQSKSTIDTESLVIDVSRPDTSSYQKAYGQYLELTFQSHAIKEADSSYKKYSYSARQRLLVGVKEMKEESSGSVSTETENEDANWTCSNFMIVKSGDRDSKIFKYNSTDSDGATHNSSCTASGTNDSTMRRKDCEATKACPYETYEKIAGGDNASKNLALLQAIRRFLPVEDWDINLSDRCVVAKSSTALSCYSNQVVSYDQVFFPSYNVSYYEKISPYVGGVEGCGVGSGYYSCPHYFSLCLRKGPSS